MRTLAVSFAPVSSQLSSAALLPTSDSRSRQALEAVDAYLQRDGIYLAPRAASSRLARLVGNLVEKLTK
jgi:hypothetical protein